MAIFESIQSFETFANTQPALESLESDKLWTIQHSGWACCTAWGSADKGSPDYHKPGKVPHGTNWGNRPITVAGYHNARYRPNVGGVIKHVPGLLVLDCDAPHPHLGKKLYEYITELLDDHSLPVRFGTRCKFAIPLIVPGGHSSLDSTGSYDLENRKCQLEVLKPGRQFIVCGMVGSSAYRWHYSDDTSTISTQPPPVDRIPKVSIDTIRRIKSKFIELAYDAKATPWRDAKGKPCLRATKELATLDGTLRGTISHAGVDWQALESTARNAKDVSRETSSNATVDLVQQINNLYDLFSELNALIGIERVTDTRWITKDSTSGQAGIVYSHEKQKFFMHHSNIFNDGYWHDVADVLCIKNGIAYDKGNHLIELARTLILPNGRTLEQENRYNYGVARIKAKTTAGVVEYQNDPQQHPSLANINIEPLDVFASESAPPLPIDCLPSHWQDLCNQWAVQVGSDAGQFAFSLLLYAAGVTDHRTRIRVNDSWSRPLYQWGFIAGDSGAGKSTPLALAKFAPSPIWDAVRQKSAWELLEWETKVAELKPKEKQPPKPKRKARNAHNATLEILAEFAANEPRGITLDADELMSILGQLDAYRGGDGMDRPYYLSAWNGVECYIDRKSADTIRVPHWSLSLIGTVQYDKLAQQYGKSGSGDGLLQRFLCYTIKSNGKPNTAALVDEKLKSRIESDFIQLADEPQRVYQLSAECMSQLDTISGHQRTLASAYGGRFGEHLSKYTDFLLRMTGLLHCIEYIGKGERIPATVDALTFASAERIMQCLFKHSEIVYSLVDGKRNDLLQAVKAIAEIVLALGKETINSRTIQQRFKGWASLDDRVKRNVIDWLINAGWLSYTDNVKTWAVNPRVFERFAVESERIKRRRAANKAALDRLKGN